MRVRRADGAILIEGDDYRLELDPAQPLARLTDGQGGQPTELLLLASLDSERGPDSTFALSPAEVEEADDEVSLTFGARSTGWESKTLRLRCRPDELVFDATVTGRGRLSEVRVLGGWYSANRRWGSGRFHSRWPARMLFSPGPDDPRRVLQPASEPAVVGVVGGDMPGRGHWFFTPGPFLFAGSAGAHGEDAAPWQVLELRCAIEEANFSQFRYEPYMGGFSLVLSYDGRLPVEGSFTTPALAIRPSVGDPYRAVGELSDRLRAEGLAPQVVRRPAEWWSRPIFCGWGEQCRQARLSGIHPTSLSRGDEYERWLGHLEARGVVPGTIVLDDKWQLTYGRNAVDEERWPDLRGWIGQRHARDQRVLLWFKAWDPEGLPPDACITDPFGRPVAADPDSPAYRQILRESLARMLGRGGLDADGLKVDFTAQTPSGPGFRQAGSAWGAALLHRLLALVYDFAKEAKQDALVVTHTPNPLFADVTDMIRLNDLLRLRDPDPRAQAVEQMTHRARIAAAVDSGLLIDTDDWCMPSRAEWRAYLAAKPGLGVPALYYATGIDHSEEAFGEDDYAAIRAAWAEWEGRHA